MTLIVEGLLPQAEQGVADAIGVQAVRREGLLAVEVIDFDLEKLQQETMEIAAVNGRIDELQELGVGIEPTREALQRLTAAGYGELTEDEQQVLAQRAADNGGRYGMADVMAILEVRVDVGVDDLEGRKKQWQQGVMQGRGGLKPQEVGPYFEQAKAAGAQFEADRAQLNVDKEDITAVAAFTDWLAEQGIVVTVPLEGGKAKVESGKAEWAENMRPKMIRELLAWGDDGFVVANPEELAPIMVEEGAWVTIKNVVDTASRVRSRYGQDLLKAVGDDPNKKVAEAIKIRQQARGAGNLRNTLNSSEWEKTDKAVRSGYGKMRLGDFVQDVLLRFDERHVPEGNVWFEERAKDVCGQRATEDDVRGLRQEVILRMRFSEHYRQEGSRLQLTEAGDALWGRAMTLWLEGDSSVTFVDVLTQVLETERMEQMVGKYYRDPGAGQLAIRKLMQFDTRDGFAYTDRRVILAEMLKPEYAGDTKAWHNAEGFYSVTANNLVRRLTEAAESLGGTAETVSVADAVEQIWKGRKLLPKDADQKTTDDMAASLWSNLTVAQLKRDVVNRFQPMVSRGFVRADEDFWGELPHQGRSDDELRFIRSTVMQRLEFSKDYRVGAGELQLSTRGQEYFVRVAWAMQGYATEDAPGVVSRVWAGMTTMEARANAHKSRITVANLVTADNLRVVAWLRNGEDAEVSPTTLINDWLLAKAYGGTVEEAQFAYLVSHGLVSETSSPTVFVNWMHDMTPKDETANERPEQGKQIAASAVKRLLTMAYDWVQPVAENGLCGYELLATILREAQRTNDEIDKELIDGLERLADDIVRHSSNPKIERRRTWDD